MTDSAIVVTAVTTRGDTATIEFADGHRAAFEGYSHGFGYQIEGLRHFFLYRGSEKIVQYDARLHYAGPQDDEHRFVQVEEGYTVERIASYWEAAKMHLNDEYFEKPYNEGREGLSELWFPWRVTSEGWMDLRNIKEGRVPLPGSTP